MLRLLRRVRYALQTRQFERDLHEELNFHLEMKQREHEAAGSGAHAAASSRRDVGNVMLARDHARDVWLPLWYQGLSLDLKLGLRMLVKYPWLTIVGGTALAFGIGAGVAGYEGLNQLVNPTLPFEDARRIIGIRIHNVQTNRSHLRTAVEFARWRQDITRIEEIAAFSNVSSNLIIPGGVPEPVNAAQMTASGFRVVRVPALLGRTLLDTDESGAAPAVAVIGFDLWQRRFAADPAVLGQSVQLGREHVTVVGVMPEGFAFPVAHEMWVPVRDDTLEVRPDAGPELLMFGRLAAGVTREGAEAELLTVSSGHSTDGLGARAPLRPQVIPFASLIIDPSDIQQVHLYANLFLFMLLAVSCANVALLIFTRTATRQGEIALRSALGATRRRIVGQLFVEAFVLSLLAVTIGLAGARSVLSSYWSMYAADSGRPLPFWIGSDLSPTTMLYAAVLTVLAATIISVMPALKVTGRGRLAQLRQSTTGGGGYQFGGVWTVVFVGQVAIALAFPVVGFYCHRWVVLSQARDLGFPAHQFLSARLELPPDERGSSPLAEFARQLVTDPGVVGVTFANRLPGTLHERARVERDDPASPSDGYVVHVASVESNFFAVFGADIRMGRGFTAVDSTSEGSGVIIVNESFVKDVMKGRNPIGERIRRMAREQERSGPWLEIVGVVPDLGIGTLDQGGSGMYSLLDTDRMPSVHAAIRTRGMPESFAPKLRTVAAAVHPALQIHEVAPLPAAVARRWLESQYMARLLIAMSAVALLLSLTVIYSVTAVAVSQRTREIGIRVALGASPRRVISTILRRPLMQLSLGVLAGAIAAALIAQWMSVGMYGVALKPLEALLMVPYAAAMMTVCLVACVVPTRRALGLAPADVLRAEA